MTYESKIDQDGRTTIPTAVRQKIGAQQGDQLTWTALRASLLHVQLQPGRGRVANSQTLGDLTPEK